MNASLSDPLLEAAVYHLSRRNFSSCRSYALRAQASSPLNSNADQILAIADTLAAAETRISETLTDWYAILQIYCYSQDSNLITSQFKRLSLLLYPEDNKFPFAEEAFKLVCEAGSVLSNYGKKTQFDNELQAFELRKDETFWTMCPYCYCMYEYVRVYEDCCLRCQNVKCGRGFQAVAVESPPLDVVEEGEFKCMGFVPLGFDEKGDSNWNPFTPLVKVKKSDGNKNAVDGVGNEGNNREDFIDLTDESSDSDDGVGRENVGGHGNGNDDEVAGMGGLQQNNSFENPVMKRRKKSVPRNAKKLMGKGPRARRMETVGRSGEGLDLNTRAGEDNNGGNGIGNSNRPLAGGEVMGNVADFDTTGVDLLAGDDDIIVSFPDLF